MASKVFLPFLRPLFVPKFPSLLNDSRQLSTVPYSRGEATMNIPPSMQEPKQTLPYGGDRLQTKIRKVRGNNEKSRNHVQQGPGQTLPYRGDLFQTNTRKVKGNIEQLRHHVQQEPEQTLPYHIHRTASQQLPVYHDSKRGGNLLQTKIRNISGNIEPLRHAVQRALGLGDEQIVINRLTGHIIIKGHMKADVVRFLEQLRF